MNAFFKILVYGYGNPGRQDDGLGIQLVNELETWAREKGIDQVCFDTNYQLNIEDAEIISNYDMVIFADASVEEMASGVALTSVSGENELTFTTHAASPGYIVHLCRKLFEKVPKAYLLHLKGYEWEFKEGLSHKAQVNLGEAKVMMKEILSKPDAIDTFLSYRE